MRDFPADTLASAVYLADHGEVYITTDFKLRFTRHFRIKVLDERGLEYGDFRITYYSKDGAQRIHEIRAQTINPGDGRRPDIKRLGRRDFRTENIDDRYSSTVFTLPDVQPGSVLEVEYTMISDTPFFLSDWAFQKEIPVMYSQFRAFLPNPLTYSRVFQAALPLAVQDVSTYYATDRRDIYLDGLGGQVYTWGMEDVPALRDEPFVAALDNHRSVMRFQLARVAFAGSPARTILTDWNSLKEDVLKGDMGRHLRPRREWRDVVRQVVPEGAADELKARLLFRHVADLPGNNRLSFVADTDPENVLTGTPGNSASKALLLVGLLREAGLEANPVLVSTRSNGLVRWEYPLINQFNHMVVELKIGNKDWLLDPLDAYQPFGVLSFQSLNDKGLAMAPGPYRLVSLEPTEGIRIRSQMNLAPDSTLGVTGTLQFLLDGYAAVGVRRTLKQATDQDQYIHEQYLSDIPGAVRLSHSITGLDHADSTLMVMVDFRSDQLLQDAGDLLLMDVVLFNRVKANPFLRPNRRFPVDFGTTQDYQFVLNVTPPAGFELETLPPPARTSLRQDAQFLMQAVRTPDRGAVISSQLRFRKPVYSTSDYAPLREFYDRVATAHQSQLLFKRVEP